jgi:hypothetical protein
MSTVMAEKTFSEEASMAPTGIDHLVYACANLERGVDEIEALLGVRPVRGGHHPQYGTHNAQLSLGSGIYIEIIARDPELPAPERGAYVEIPATSQSRLITWVFRTDDIQQIASNAAHADIGLGPVQSGSRIKPDGSKICWQLTDPYAMPFGGAIPFLIDWGNAIHPSKVVPAGGTLVQLVIEHPEADRVRRAIRALGAEVLVVEDEKFGICATIETKDGLVTLR